MRFECSAWSNNDQAQDRLSITWSKEGSSAQTLEIDPRFQISGRDPRRPTYLVVSRALFIKHHKINVISKSILVHHGFVITFLH